MTFVEEKVFQLEKEYDLLYDEANALFLKEDPCQIKNGSCFAGELCCDKSCSHLGPTGCKIKSLCCKLWVCSSILINNKDFCDKLKPLVERAIALDILIARGTKKETLYLLKKKYKSEQILKYRKMAAFPLTTKPIYIKNRG